MMKRKTMNLSFTECLHREFLPDETQLPHSTTNLSPTPEDKAQEEYLCLSDVDFSGLGLPCKPRK